MVVVAGAGAGGAVHECGLCGARFGERRAVRESALEAEALRRGVAPEVWPLAKVLDALPGFALGSACGRAQGELPMVTLIVSGQEALVQLENLAKVLRLAAGRLRCRWSIEVRFEQALVVVVYATGRASSARDACVDVEELAQQVDRSSRLSWWRHATDW